MINYLSKGSNIAIAAPARKVSREEMQTAINWIEKKGFNPIFDDDLFLSENQFAGNDTKRAEVLQRYINSPEIDAIFMARGGYGSVRIIDKLDFSPMLVKHKWIVGYSDVTVFHTHLQSLGIPTLHATMPINFATNTENALDSLYNALSGNEISYMFNANKLNLNGNFKGKIIGGNLSVLYSTLSSRSFPNLDGCVLFIEDLDEYLYHIDRMVVALRRSGTLDKICGIVVGAMSDMHDNTIPFGKTAEEIILDNLGCLGVPIIFDMPAGHIKNNNAIIMGIEALICVENDIVTFTQKPICQ